jgi:hypothetical protein
VVRTVGSGSTTVASSVNREALLRRRAGLQAGLDRQRLDASATDGAIQEVDYWLAELDKEEHHEHYKEEKPDGEQPSG